MASKDEKLCMAAIRNSTVTNINWNGVAKDLGVGTANAANCQWRRFKKAKFSDVAQPTKPIKTNGNKKRPIDEMSDGEEERVVRKQPEKKKKRGGRQVKMETPELDSEEVEFEEDWGDEI